MTEILTQVEEFSAILSFVISLISLLAYRENRSRMPLFVGCGFAIFGFSYLLTIFSITQEMDYVILLIRMFGFVTVLFAVYTNLGEVRNQITLLSEKNASLQSEIQVRTRAEQELMTSESRLNAVIQGSPIPQFVISKDHKVLYWNNALRAYSGISSADVIGTNQHWRAFYDTERPCMADLLVDGTVEKIAAWYAGKYSPSPLVEGAYEATDFIPRLGKAGTWLHFTAAPIRDEAGTIVGAVETLEDITDRKRAEEALRESEAKYHTLFDKTRDAVLIIENNLFVDCNAAALGMLGYVTKDELFLTHPSKISPPVQPDGRSSFEKAEELMAITLRDGSNRFEWMHRRANGEDFWVEVSLTAIPLRDHQIIHTAWRDITDRKKAEAEIQRSLDEKEVLLKEIHHRVKNNLQVVWGLIDLQIQTLKDPRMINILRDSQNRIRTMSLIHETLYKSRDLSHIEILPYLRSLVSTLFSTYSISPEKIQVQFAIENVLLDAESAIPCGLIVNELMSNAFKHAFPGDRTGTISVGFALENGMYTLVFSDTGVGMPPGFDYLATESLGLKLVNVLATDQLDGSIELIPENGTKFIIRFPERIPAPAQYGSSCR
nr:histidine kinase dimerization/phosphoacceptor domain -containing protein [uncultured Methanoregula sp.]